MNTIQFQHTSKVLDNILKFQQPADGVLAAYWRNHRQLGRQDRQVIADTVFTVLRHYQKISALIKKPIQQTRLVVLLALTLMNQNIPLETLSSEEQTLLEQYQRAFKDLQQSNSLPLNQQTELPAWLIQRLQNHQTNEEIIAFANSINQTAPLDIRVNTLKARRDKVLSVLQQEFEQVEPTPYAPYGIRLGNKPSLNQHSLFQDGCIEIQDEGSQLLVQLLQAKRGEMIVDFCAGAGGKTLAIAAQMANQGRIYACDVSDKRLANLKPRMQRAGVNNINLERISSEIDPRLARLHQKADKVLVDVPCSGLGTLRRNPDLKYRQTPDTLQKLCELQQNIFQAASNLVAIGGRLVYATCSMLPEENEQQVEKFLQHNPQFELLNCAEILASQKIHLDTGKYLKLNPAQHQTDGFFAAVIQRTAK